MIFNSILPRKVSVLQCGMDITMTGGTNTTRVFDLSSVWDHASLSAEKIHVIPRVWTYQSPGTSVSPISYSYSASTGTLTMTIGQPVLNADWSFDAQGWMIIIVRS